jgi:hypothetical protein
MIVTVLHSEFDRDTGLPTGHATTVAKFNFSVDNDNDGCELAYYHTQNLRDSWSNAGSEDSHPTLELLKPREVIDGVEYGHRSSIVGDLMYIDRPGFDQPAMYRVATFGFERIN